MKVELIDHMGSDLSVVNAARVSFDKESDWEITGYREEVNLDSRSVTEWPLYKLSDKDAKLINYLAKHNHWTPFGHCYATFRIKAPIFVARQLGKHQVGLVWNEVSRRYVDSEPEFYTPEVWRKRADNVKQGSLEVEVDKGDLVKENYDKLLVEAEWLYSTMLADGVCPEQARIVLPQSTLTEWWWSGSLAAFARVCKLRLDPHTQRETASVAAKMYDELEKVFPVSWAALMNYE